MHKPKLMKLTPGAGAFYVISPGNRSRPLYSSTCLHWVQN